jgi:hypothetical protein
MSNTDHNKPTGKSGRRNRKAEQRNRKPDREQSPKPDQQTHVEVKVEAIALPSRAAPSATAAAADPVPVSLQTIANAYGDYTRKLLDETNSFVEKLTGVRSFDKVVEVQTEFAKQVYQTFVTDSKKLRELHGELARQTLKPLQGLAARTTGDVR